VSKVKVGWAARIGAILGACYGLLLPTATVQPAESTSGDRKDWIIVGQAQAAEEINVALNVSPRPLVYGRVYDATIEVENGTPNGRTILIRALLGEVAHFVSGDFDVRFEHPDQAEQQRKIVWPTLDLPAGARGRVSFAFLVSRVAKRVCLCPG